MRKRTVETWRPSWLTRGAILGSVEGGACWWLCFRMLSVPVRCSVWYKKGGDEETVWRL